MPKEIDKRNMSAFAAFESDDSDRNSWTGNRRTLKMSKPVLLQGGLMEKAVSFLLANKESFGFENISAAQFVAEGNISETSTGEKTVHVQQVYKGIPVFLVNKAIIFDQQGAIETTVGDTVNILEDIDIEPKVNVMQAAEVAALAILADDDKEEPTNGWGEPVTAEKQPAGVYTPKKLVEFTDLPSRPTVLDKSIFAEDVRANLVIFYIGPQAVLAWYFTITVAKAGPQYDIVIAADNPANVEVLYLKNTSQHAVAKGNVHPTNGSDRRVMIDFPLAISRYPFPSNGTILSFREWVLKDETKGVNVVVHPANSTNSFKGEFNGTTVVFNPSSLEDQQMLNIFYFCNFMHDFFFLLGFDEKAGSFDGDDPLVAKVHTVEFAQTATMLTPIDGSSPVMNLGFVTSSGRHTALDCDVVFHEYVHGVTKRLVGGRTNPHSLKEDQSRAMGEGWSDYFALTIQNFNNEVEKVTTGSWVKNNSIGVRSHPYNDDYAKHRTYGKISGIGGEHSRGEVWCAALMHWTRHLSKEIGKEHAYQLCWQSVLDGLKLINANPTFLEARDGILRAVEALEKQGVITHEIKVKTQKQFWISFATFGMGVNAHSPSPSVHGIMEDFTTPKNFNK